MCGGGGDGGAGAMQAQEDARKADVTARIADINGIFDANAGSGVYGELGSALLERDTFLLDEQREDAERQNRFALARQGLSGGSQEVDRNTALLDVYNEGRLQAGERANRSVAEWKSADEDLRNTLIRQVSADPSAFNAAATNAQLNAGADARRNAGVDQSLTQLFDNFKNDYALTRYSNGYQAGMGTAGTGTALPTTVNPRKSYQGV